MRLLHSTSSPAALQMAPRVRHNTRVPQLFFVTYSRRFAHYVNPDGKMYCQPKLDGIAVSRKSDDTFFANCLRCYRKAGH